MKKEIIKEQIFIIVISSAISEMEKKINEYKKAAQNAVDEFDDILNYGKSRAMQEAIEILKKHCA